MIYNSPITLVPDVVRFQRLFYQNNQIKNLVTNIIGPSVIVNNKKYIQR